jgi:hypothetical protein
MRISIKKTKLGKKVIQFTIGTRSVPLPIHIKLIPIAKALDPIWWGGSGRWQLNRINLKQKYLARALRGYPKYVRANINKGMLYNIMSVQ